MFQFDGHASLPHLHPLFAFWATRGFPACPHVSLPLRDVWLMARRPVAPQVAGHSCRAGVWQTCLFAE